MVSDCKYWNPIVSGVDLPPMQNIHSLLFASDHIGHFAYQSNCSDLVWLEPPRSDTVFTGAHCRWGCHRIPASWSWWCYSCLLCKWGYRFPSSEQAPDMGQSACTAVVIQQLGSPLPPDPPCYPAFSCQSLWPIQLSYHQPAPSERLAKEWTSGSFCLSTADGFPLAEIGLVPHLCPALRCRLSVQSGQCQSSDWHAHAKMGGEGERTMYWGGNSTYSHLFASSSCSELWPWGAFPSHEFEQLWVEQQILAE